jgi:hypothetical protein
LPLEPNFRLGGVEVPWCPSGVKNTGESYTGELLALDSIQPGRNIDGFGGVDRSTAMAGAIPSVVSTSSVKYSSGRASVWRP